MLTTIALAAFIAAPAPQPQTDADADSAARVGTEGLTSVYDFTEADDVMGEILAPDGSLIRQEPKPIMPSLLSIRAHFLPELITLATDV